MNILSLFDGISCARVALERAGIPVERYYASEIDKYAIQIAQKNYPDTIQVGSVVNLKGSDFNDIDLIVGGSPCQDLSIAKKGREGLSGARSGLFWEYVRILNEVKPKYFILENVNSMPRDAKQTITETLWGIEPVMINAALVSAQNRKRLFWVGILVGDRYEKVDVPQPEDRGILLKDILENNVDERYNISTKTLDTFSKPSGKNGSFAPMKLRTGEDKAVTLTARYFKMGRTDNYVGCIAQIGKGGQGGRIYSTGGKSTALSANGGGGGAKTGLYAVAQRGRNIVNGKRKDILGAKTEQRIEIGQTEKAHAITSVSKDSMVMENHTIRKLTPVECERLQSLPDNYTEGISNSQRYKALGNAFNVEVVAHILKGIIN
jgi:DNA (cytosine-5)-methyltransferase 3A